MATRKTAVPKATDVLEKQQSEQSRRNESLSIFFTQGETFQIEGLPETIENLVVKMYARDAKGDTHLADVTGEKNAPGAFKATVPVLDAESEPETFAVCGVPIAARSYTQDEYYEWLELSRSYKLTEAQAEIQKIKLEVRRANTNSTTVSSAKERLPSFLEAYKRLVAEEKEDPFAFADTGKEKQLQLALARIEELSAVILEGEKDPVVQLQETGGKSERWEELEKVNREAQLEFIQRLATRESLTTEKFEAWRKRATGKDFGNVQELMEEGNDFWLYGQDAAPLSRKERRKLMRDVNQVVRDAKRAVMKAGGN